GIDRSGSFGGRTSILGSFTPAAQGSLTELDGPCNPTQVSAILK
ncbi:MAG: hypothetical protein ACI81V_000683, partial [Lentimonas sp.]